MKTLPASEVAKELEWHLNKIGITDLSKGPKAEDVVRNYCERTHTLKEMAQKAACYYQDITEYDQAGVKKWIKEGSVEILQASLEALKALSSWDAKSIDEALENVAKAKEVGMGKVGQPLRIAITGSAMSPGIGDTMMLVGQQRTFDRIQKAIEHFSSK